MTLIMLRCTRCAEPIGVAPQGAHRAKRAGRGDRGDRYAHADTNRARCGVVAGRSLWGTAEPDVDRLVRDTVAVLDDEYTLLDVNRGDEGLTARQIQVLLDGVDECASMEYTHLEIAEAQQRCNAAFEVVRELLDPELYEMLDQAGRLDEIQQEVEQRDTSSLVQVQLTVSPSSLFRFDLGVDVPDYTLRDEGYAEIIEDIAHAAGLNHDDPDVEHMITMLLADASYGGRLSVLWYTDPADAIALAAPLDPDAASGTVTFTNAHLLILDSWNGSGNEVLVPTITAQWSPQRVSIDAANMGGGYSWTDTAGPVTSAYAGDYGLTRARANEEGDPSGDGGRQADR